jgi:hypothetical protein
MNEAVSKTMGMEYVDNAASPIIEFVMSKLNPDLANHSANLNKIMGKGSSARVTSWNNFVDKLDNDIASNITAIMQNKFKRMFGGTAPSAGGARDRHMPD